MSIEQQIRDKIESAMAYDQLEVVNESALHAGHSGDDGSGESHFKIEIVSDAFRDMSRVNCQRHVHKVLGAELIAKIHALNIICKKPSK